MRPGRREPSLQKIKSNYQNWEVELSDEREAHIAERHPDLLPRFKKQVLAAISDPDEVRRSKRMANALLFTRWFENVRGGKHVVSVVVSQGGNQPRHWVITAYMAKKMTEESEMIW